MKIKYKIKEILPQVFCVTFDTAYDMCMTFCRYQEFYESASKEIKGKKDITLATLMRDYSFKYGKGAFTYARDWAGFNLPDWVFDKMSPLDVNDQNEYDLEMQKILDYIHKHQQAPGNFYIIGVCKEIDKMETVRHEMAHALYYTNDDYRKGADQLISQISETKKQKLHKLLRGMNYADDVLDDELQAYCATGLFPGMSSMKKSPRLLKKFVDHFTKYWKL